jgi:hypothetical protein
MLCEECGAEMISTMFLGSKDGGKLTKYECLECDNSELVPVRSEDCFKPNNDPYPLCVGNGKEECKTCCLYENMIEDTD